MQLDYLLTDQTNERINRIIEIADTLPGVVIIHRLEDLSIEYMSQKGLDQLGLTLEQAKCITSEQYHDRYFNPEDAKTYIPLIIQFLQRNTDESITYFQQVRTSENGDWVWHMSSMRILTRDENGKPLHTITTSVPVDPMQHITSKVSRLLDENNFLRKHYHEFSTLGKRELDVLKLIALGKSAVEIAEELFISPTTVETHRKNIKQKLKVTSAYSLSQYARAFDLI